MTPEENKAIIRRFYDEVMGQGRVQVLDEIMDPDFVDHGEALFGSPRGRDVLGQAIAGSHSILTGLSVNLEDIIAEGEMVGVRGTMRCVHQGTFLGVAGTGHELSWKGLAMFRIVNGKIVERWFNSDSVSILRQMRLAPGTAQPGN